MNAKNKVNWGVVAAGCLLLAACGGGDSGGSDADGGGDEKLGPLRCAEISGSTALLMSKVTGGSGKAISGVGTKSLETAGSYDENPFTAGLFSKVELMSASGNKSLDSIPENVEKIRFYDMDNDSLGAEDDVGDYVFVFAPAKDRPFFLIRKKDNAILYPDVRPLLPEGKEWSSSNFYMSDPQGRVALADNRGNIYVSSVDYYYTRDGGPEYASIPVIRVESALLNSSPPGAYVPVEVVSLDGDDQFVELLAADGDNGVVAYGVTNCESGGSCDSTLRVINVRTGGFRNLPQGQGLPFQISGRAFAFSERTRTDSCGIYSDGTPFEVENSVLQVVRVNATGETVVWEAPACVRLDTFSPVFYDSRSLSEYGPGQILVWLSYSRERVENDNYFYEYVSVPAVVRESGLQLLENVGREISSRLGDGSFSRFECAPEVCLGLSNGRAIGFNPNADDAAQIFEVEGISVRSLFPGETGVTFDGNELATGDRVIGLVNADGSYEVKASIGTEIQQYVPLRKSNTDPVACSSSG